MLWRFEILFRDNTDKILGHDSCSPFSLVHFMALNTFFICILIRELFLLGIRAERTGLPIFLNDDSDERWWCLVPWFCFAVDRRLLVRDEAWRQWPLSTGEPIHQTHMAPFRNRWFGRRIVTGNQAMIPAFQAHDPNQGDQLHSYGWNGPVFFYNINT